jgi:hypothetical protein
MFAIHNLSDRNQKFSYSIKKSVKALTDLLTQQQYFPVGDHIEIDLMPYQYLWLID